MAVVVVVATALNSGRIKAVADRLKGKFFGKSHLQIAYVITYAAASTDAASDAADAADASDTAVDAVDGEWFLNK